MNGEAFAKAVSKVLMRYSEEKMEIVDVSEIWIDTSIPKDLIIELITKGLVRVPEGIEKIKDGKRILWRRT